MAIDWTKFYKNRSAFPPEELARYAGQWVAWHPSGSNIVACSRQSDQAVYDQLVARGYDPAECCLTYVPHENDIIEGAVIVKRALEHTDPPNGPPG